MAGDASHVHMQLPGCSGGAGTVVPGLAAPNHRVGCMISCSLSSASAYLSHTLQLPLRGTGQWEIPFQAPQDFKCLTFGLPRAPNFRTPPSVSLSATALA